MGQVSVSNKTTLSKNLKIPGMIPGQALAGEAAGGMEPL